MSVIMAMGVSGLFYYNFSVVPMKNKIEEQAKVIIAAEKRAIGEGFFVGY